MMSVVVFVLLSLLCVEAQLDGRHIVTQEPLGRYVHGLPSIFKPAVLCPLGERVTGYRVQVQNPHVQDKVGLTGLEMKCSGGSVIGPVGIVDSGLGNWTMWRECASPGFVTGFNLRTEDKDRYHHRRDYYGATQIKMKCSNDVELGPDGLGVVKPAVKPDGTDGTDTNTVGVNGVNGEENGEDGTAPTPAPVEVGKWARETYAGCSATSSLCGFAAEVQDYQGPRRDDTGINRVRFICCSKSQGDMKELPGMIPLGKDICIGTQNEKYGFVKMPASGFLNSMTFHHVDGLVNCHPETRFATNFGCDYNKFVRDAFSIFVTTSDNQIILPDKDKNQFKFDNLFYEVVGASSRDAKEFTLQPDTPTFVNKGDEVRFWYGEDLRNRHDQDNGNYEVCVNVYGQLMN